MGQFLVGDFNDTWFGLSEAERQALLRHHGLSSERGSSLALPAILSYPKGSQHIYPAGLEPTSSDWARFVWSVLDRIPPGAAPTWYRFKVGASIIARLMSADTQARDDD